MDLNQLLVWTVCLSSLSFFVRTLLSPHGRGWSLVSGSIFTITITLFFFTPQWASIVGGTLWALFLILPLLGLSQVNKLIDQERYQEARHLALWLRWLHPGDGWLEQPMILKALEMGQQGNITQALRTLQPYKTHHSSLGRSATALLFLMGAKWEELLHWIRTHVPEKVLVKDPHLILYYLRALGEVGDLNGMIRGFERYEQTLEKGGNPIPLNLVRMFILSFCGQSEGIERLFQQSLATYSPRIKTFWRITAQMAASSSPLTRKQLLELNEGLEDTILSQAIAWRLEHPPINPDTVLTLSAWRKVNFLKQEIDQEVRYGNPLAVSQHEKGVTYGLILLNLIVFMLEGLAGGSQNPETLDQLGALIPSAVVEGEKWRLVMANFLHYGSLHLFANMVGLYLLGPFVETSLGTIRYLLIYLGSGVGSMLVFTAIALAQNDPYQRLVGASASIMGLLGAIVAIFFWGWVKENSAIAAKRLRLFLFIILLQFMFDLTVPQVSMLAHALGLGFGFLLGLLLLTINK